MGPRGGFLIREVTAPYSYMEALGYDRMVGSAGAKIVLPLVTPVVEGVREGGRVLDVGCGGGHLMAALASKHATVHFQGVDLSASQVGWARKRTMGFGGRVGIVRGSALGLPYRDGMFDLVLSIASIKHWPDPGRGLREVVRVLRPGGVFWVLEGDRGCRLEDARRFAGRLPLVGPLRSILLPILRTYILGQGWDGDEARRLLVELGVSEGRLERAEGLPFLTLTGTK